PAPSSRRAQVPWARPSDAPDLHEPALRPRDGAADEQEVALGVDLVHDEPGLGDAGAAHPARHLHSLEDARGIRGRSDRARLADVVRPVRHGATREPVALDRALVALPDREPAHLDPVARLERLDGHGLADGEAALAAQLDEVAVRADARLPQVADLGLRELALGNGVEGELDRVVAVRVRRLHLDDWARPRLDD